MIYDVIYSLLALNKTRYFISFLFLQWDKVQRKSRQAVFNFHSSGFIFFHEAQKLAQYGI